MNMKIKKDASNKSNTISTSKNKKRYVQKMKIKKNASNNQI